MARRRVCWPGGHSLILDRRTGALRAVYDRHLEGLSWSPDGTSLAGLQLSNTDPTRDDNEIVIVPIAGLK